MVAARLQPGARADPWAWASVLWLAALFGYLLWWIYRAELPLAEEEAQYWDWSRRLDWSYYSKPPLIAWLIRAGTAVAGDTPLAVRGVAWTLGLITAVLVWRLARRLYGSHRVVFLSLLAALLMPLYAVGCHLATTDAPLLCCWAGCALSLHRAATGDARWPWWAAGACLGLGLLAKYTMALFLPCALLYLAAVPERRRWLRRPELWGALLLGLALFAPVVAWNWSRDWVSVRHVLGLAGADVGFGLDAARFGRFLAGQAGLVSPVLFLAMLAVACVVVRRPAPEADRFLLCLGLPVLVFFTLKSLQAPVYANWAAPAYLTWAMLVAARLDRAWRGASSVRRRLLAAAVVLGVAIPVALLVVAHERSAWRSLVAAAARVGITVPPRADPQFRLLGWDQLGARVSAIRAAMPDPASTFLFTERYQIAAELAFYVDGRPRTYTVSLGNRRMSQYDLWGGPDESKTGLDAIFIAPGEVLRLDPGVASDFARIDGPEVVVIRDRDVELRRFTAFRCYGFDGRFDAAVPPQRY
jgi:4-amino-4-deoxy-L-arabinose transferase-like glycosyltransferase